jgi:hypothetical protein
LDLFDFINPASSSIEHKADETYTKIVSNWSGFIDCLLDEDKQILLGIMSKCYYKHQKSIKAYGLSDYELSNGLLMSILIHQQIQIDGLKHK